MHVCVYILRFVVYKILRRYEEYVKEIFFFSFFNSFLEFLFSELIFTSEDSISVIGIPERIILDADNFSGRLEYQIIKTSL